MFINANHKQSSLNASLTYILNNWLYQQLNMQDYEVYNSQKKQNEQRATKRMNKKEIEEENEIERQTRKTARLYKKKKDKKWRVMEERNLRKENVGRGNEARQSTHTETSQQTQEVMVEARKPTCCCDASKDRRSQHGDSHTQRTHPAISSCQTLSCVIVTINQKHALSLTRAWAVKTDECLVNFYFEGAHVWNSFIFYFF